MLLELMSASAVLSVCEMPGSVEGQPYRAANAPAVEPVTEDESRLVEEYGERSESPGRR